MVEIKPNLKQICCCFSFSGPVSLKKNAFVSGSKLFKTCIFVKFPWLHFILDLPPNGWKRFVIRGLFLFFLLWVPDCVFTMVLSSSLFGLLTGNTGLIVGPRSLLLCAADLARRQQLLRRRCRNASYGWKGGRKKHNQTKQSMKM